MALQGKSYPEKNLQFADEESKVSAERSRATEPTGSRCRLQKDVSTRSDPHRNQQALTSTKMAATPSPPPAADMDGTWRK